MDFRNELMDDLSEYEKFYNRIEELKQEDEKLKGLSPLAEGSTKMSIMFKTMTDKSRQNMSEMLVKGFDMGIKDIDENIAKAIAVKERPQVIQLARDYRMHMVKNREKYLHNYEDMLGKPLDKYPDFTPPYEKEFVAEDGMSRIYRLKIEVFKDFFFYGILMLPLNDGKKPYPLVIAQHGGGSLPEICSDMNGANVYGNFTKRALERDFAVFIPQLLLWTFNMETGEKRVPIDLPYNRGAIDNSLKQLGTSITSLEIFCLRRSIDCLAEESFIDEKRIGMMGLSYGGYFTLYTAAIEERIRSAYAAGFFNDRAKVAFGDWQYKNHLNIFSDAEVGGLVAPRRLVIDVGKSDPVFDFSSAPEEAERIKRYYTAYGKEEEFRFYMWDGGHRFNDSGEGFEFFFDGI
jgi:dienelactone hydrolase